MNKYYCGQHRLNQKKRRIPRLRYSLIPLVLTCLWFTFAPDSPNTSSSYAQASTRDKQACEGQRQSGVKISQQNLVHINNDIIQRYNLTIDPGLQDFIRQMAEKYQIQHGAVAVMDARRGNILALYGISQTGENCTLALETEVAASIFKIITATAAMEYRGYSGNTNFFYTGGAHTLYKDQLTTKRDRWCAEISLADAFARSNNVVFGKLGSIHVGENPIQETAKRMGFGRPPVQTVEAQASELFDPKDDYERAELACGFNQYTRISPLHAAQITTSAINHGSMINPRLIASEKFDSTTVMRERTASELRAMMKKTVKSGTVSKHFNKVSNDNILKQLSIGGKSGSLDGKNPTGRRNWFAGFAQDEETGEAIAIGCVLVLHDRFLIQADVLSQLIIKEYFANQSSASTTAAISKNNAAKSKS